MKNNHYVIFYLSQSNHLSTNISKELGVENGELELKRFLDGEIYIRLKESVRGKEVFIIQPTANNVNDSLMEILILTDSLKRSSAKEVTAIIPYFGYARQDRLNKGREAITSKLVATIIESSGIDRVVTFDIHANQIQGFFNIPTDNIKTIRYLARETKKNIDLNNTIILAPDFGSVKRASVLASMLDLNLSVIDKRRVKHNDVEIQNIIGEYKGKNILMIDDMIDTGNTLKRTIEKIKNEVDGINIVATHGVFSLDKTKYKNHQEYFDEFEKLGVKNIYVTNTIDQTGREHKILKVIDISSVIAGVIDVIANKEISITEYFNKKWN